MNFKSFEIHSHFFFFFFLHLRYYITIKRYDECYNKVLLLASGTSVSVTA